MGWAENGVDKYRIGKHLERNERNFLRQALDEMEYPGFLEGRDEYFTQLTERILPSHYVSWACRKRQKAKLHSMWTAIALGWQTPVKAAS